MKTILAVIGAATVSWMLYRWLRLVWFRARALAVVVNSLGYNPSVPGLQSPIFNAITRSGLSSGWNEYDVAICFMLVQLGTLSKPLSADTHDFYYDKLKLVEMIAPMSTIGNNLISDFKSGPNAA